MGSQTGGRQYHVFIASLNSQKTQRGGGRGGQTSGRYIEKGSGLKVRLTHIVPHWAFLPNLVESERFKPIKRPQIVLEGSIDSTQYLLEGNTQ